MVTLRNDRVSEHTSWREVAVDLGVDAEQIQDALIHPSMSHARRINDVPVFQRLEFLGDSLVGLAAAQVVFEAQKNAAEGELTRRKVALVRKESLARFTHMIGLSQDLEVNVAKDETLPDSIAADAFEAFVGALFLNIGYSVIDGFLLPLFSHFEQDTLNEKHPKTRLKEEAEARAQNYGFKLLKKSGVSHAPVFEVRAFIGNLAAKGQGDSLKNAEAAAALRWFEEYKNVR